ncbi:unnamed protein product [Vitrella brassicaformis CCMP3155]|uniref:Uncharacterized protein n=1 Tax=Vitrella brassicaformis (strain CCMP3155) TaxID=1169540 RepID=A0A0G4GAA8_VITBC|nr:unnamed protein product [Vitrella brassicaformis CCMP3155]|eukprot:CEM25911.1 unnamed protein product [Vitrella brassicaformis CCMP3155]
MQKASTGSPDLCHFFCSCEAMESAGGTAEAKDDHPSPQAVRVKAGKLVDAIHTKAPTTRPSTSEGWMPSRPRSPPS